MTGGMLTLRPYRPEDAETVLSWCADERAFYQWTAGVLGPWPLSAAAFAFVERLTPFIAEAAGRPAGFFTLRRPEPEKNELRFGFVILDPALRGRGLGKEMLRLGLDSAFGAHDVRDRMGGAYPLSESHYSVLFTAYTPMEKKISIRASSIKTFP